ncbi:Dioxygenase [Streptomyces ambofaciens ATCC 23877]|uniref:Dioxygenase n=2 Tax=Streptomyces ambofaciens TaxID=1889 RepID=A0A0K2AQI6_STRA7|nr:VOC family protein [Streptomyces ambofaciens]AKZ55097.1 Dioxygenase [Streptomyces ambofaciens ATCC 23877]ANB05819.1 dioxygenase [Streptomyces ambofaciens]
MTDHTTRLDHVVLWVRDPIAAADFYEKTLGTQPLRITEYTAGTVSFPSVRLNDETILDLAPHSLADRMRMVPGADSSAGHPVNHICLALSPHDFEALRARLEEQAVPVSELSYDSYGARGLARRSFYFGDPDGNIVEARHYE